MQLERSNSALLSSVREEIEPLKGTMTTLLLSQYVEESTMRILIAWLNLASWQISVPDEMLQAAGLNNVEPVGRRPTSTKEEFEKLLARFRKSWLARNMVSGMSGVSLCVDLVFYDPEILDPYNFKVNSPIIKELRNIKKQTKNTLSVYNGLRTCIQREL